MSKKNDKIISINEYKEIVIFEKIDHLFLTSDGKMDFDLYKNCLYADIFNGSGKRLKVLFIMELTNAL